MFHVMTLIYFATMMADYSILGLSYRSYYALSEDHENFNEPFYGDQ